MSGAVIARTGLLASGSFDQTIAVWEVVTGERFRVLRGHTAGVTALVALPGGRLASGGPKTKN